MKKRFLVITFVFFPLILIGQNYKVVEGYTQVIEQGIIDEDSMLTSMKWYDDEERLIKEEEYWYDDGFNKKVTHFDLNQKKTKTILILRDESFKQTNEFIRDEKGEIKKHIMRNSDLTTILVANNEYNSSEKIEKSVMLVEGAPKEVNAQYGATSYYKYDEDGHLIELTQFIGKKKISEYKYEYNQRSERVKESYIKYQQNEKCTRLFEYNERGKNIKEITYYDGETFSTTSLKWNGDMLVSEKVFYHQEDYSEITTFRIVKKNLPNKG